MTIRVLIADDRDLVRTGFRVILNAEPDDDLTGMLRENLAAERIVITTYQEIIRWLGDGDPTTRRLMEKILAEEEEYADDIVDLLGE